MKKNRGLFFVLSTLLAVTCLLVSCNSEVSDNATGGGDKLVYATFGSGSVKALTGTTISTSYNLEEIGDVYWFYKAYKADEGGRSGAQSSWYPVIPGQKGLDGVIGPFSTGLWNFEVIAYKDCSITAPTSPATSDASVTVGETTYYMNTAVFAGSVNGVSLATGTQSNPDPINVTVTLQTSGSNGTLTLDRDFVFEWAPGGGGTTDLTLKAVYGTGDSDYKTVTLTWDSTSSKYVISSESETQWAIPAGDYEFDFEVYYTHNNVNYTVATVSDVALKVYGGQETIIKASILEGNFVYAKINATVKSTAVANTVTTDASTTFVTSYTPASVSSGSVSSTEVTTVEFPANALKATGTTVTEGYTVTSYALDVAVTDIDASQESTFTVADTTQENVVASIDLTLTMTQTSTTSSETTTITVSSFDNDGVAAVTTYIAKNLTEPVVYYDGEPFTASTTGAANTYTYDSTSGRLVIYTDHFSEFYVSSKDEAYNATTGTAYATVKDAVDAAVANQTIKLLKNCTSTDEALAFDDNGVVFDLNGKTLTVKRTGSTKSIQVTSGVTIKNGAIVGDLPTNTDSYVAVYVLADGDLTLENVDITVNKNGNNESQYAVAVLASGTENDPVSLTINGGTFDGMVGSNGRYRYVAETINDGTFNAGVYFPAEGVYTIGNGVFNDIVEVKSGSLTINGGLFNNVSESPSYVVNHNGSTMTGVSVGAVAYNNTANYGATPTVTINGGTFAGKIGLADGDDTTYPTVTINSSVEVDSVYFAHRALQAAINAAPSGGTVILCDNLTDSNNTEYIDGKYKFNINKSLTLDGNGKSITSNRERVIGVNQNGMLMVDVVIKNLEVTATANGGMPIITRGNINSLTLRGVNLYCTGSSGYMQGLTIGGDQSSKATITIDGCIIESPIYYAIIMWNPVDMTITNSSIKGWACLYFKPDSAYSSVYLEGCNLTSINNNAGSSNSFSMITTETDYITVELNGCQIESGYKDPTDVGYQSLFMTSGWSGPNSGLTIVIYGDNTSISTPAPVGSVTYKPSYFFKTDNDSDLNTIKVKDTLYESLSSSIRIDQNDGYSWVEGTDGYYHLSWTASDTVYYAGYYNSELDSYWITSIPTYFINDYFNADWTVWAYQSNKPGSDVCLGYEITWSDGPTVSPTKGTYWTVQNVEEDVDNTFIFDGTNVSISDMSASGTLSYTHKDLEGSVNLDDCDTEELEFWDADLEEYSFCKAYYYQIPGFLIEFYVWDVSEDPSECTILVNGEQFFIENEWS